MVSFALHDGDEHFVFGTDTAQEGVPLGTRRGGPHAPLRDGSAAVHRGQVLVTVGVHSRDNRRTYHVQDQRYSFEVPGGLEGRVG